MMKPVRRIVATCAVISISASIVAPWTCLSAPTQQVNINGKDNKVAGRDLNIYNGVGKSELRSVRKDIQELKQFALQQNLEAAQSKPAFQKIVQNIYHKPYAALTEREHITFWENVQAALELAEKAERDFEIVKKGTVNAQLRALFPKIEAARNDFNYDEVNRLLSEFRNNHKDLRQDLARVDFLQGQNYELQLNYVEGERYYKKAAVNDDENTLYLDAHATILQKLGRYAEAEPLFRRALAIDEKSLGTKHPYVATSLNNLAESLREQGKYAEAEPLYRRAIAIGEKTLGPEHPDVANGLNNLVSSQFQSVLYFPRHCEEHSDAAIHAEAAKSTKDGSPRPDRSGLAMTNLRHFSSDMTLAELLREQGKYAEAEPLFRRALAISEKALGPEHPNVAKELNNLAALLQAQGKYAEAEPLFRRALAIDEKALGSDHPDFAIDLNNLAALLQDQGKYAEAEPLYRRALAIDEKALGSDHPGFATDLNNLAELLKAQGKYAEAEPLYRRALAIDEKAFSSEHPDVARQQNNLAGFLYEHGKYAEAEPLYHRALAIDEKALGPKHPTTIIIRNNLNELLEMNKH